jgi:dCMP deaminase
MSRITKDEMGMMIALVCARRATCIRRQVGCVLVNERGHVLATGYNGPSAGMAHCIDEPCGGHDNKPGEGLEQCQAIHAEQNALLQCHDVYEISTCYCTATPCRTCLKLLMNTGCQRIIYLRLYPNYQDVFVSEIFWKKSGMGRRMFQILMTKNVEVLSLGMKI